MDLAALIPLGASATRSVIVTPALTVGQVYPGLPLVYATCQMILLMEMAAADVIASLLPAGWGSVGTHVDVRHLAASAVGMCITAQARVLAVDQRTVTFAVSADDGCETIGDGRHSRAPVELSRFIERVERKFKTHGVSA